MEKQIENYLKIEKISLLDCCSFLLLLTGFNYLISFFIYKNLLLMFEILYDCNKIK